MKLVLAASILVSLVGMRPALAADGGDDAPVPEGFRPGKRIKVPLPENMAGGGAFSRILFLNRCAGGCTISPGYEDSTTNHSGIVSGTRQLSAYDGNQWDEILQCVQQIFSPFDVTVTDVDPGATNHMEAVVAGEGSQLGFGCDVNGCTLGVAPYSCGYIGNSMSYTFANMFDNYYQGAAQDARRVNEICATIGQEAAHSWGLDHQMLASDPMTYLDYSSRRTFKDQAVRCGEYNERNCDCSGATQNSYQEILATFGSADPTPPDVEITNRASGDQVSPGFAVAVDASDTSGVDHVELWINNVMVDTTVTLPYVLHAPDNQPDGTLHLEARAFDAQGTLGSDTVDVILGPPCETPGDCMDAGDNYTCVGGRCVPGEGAVGGLGTACDSGIDCYSGLCLNDGTDKLCAELCDLGAGQCPSGYGCLDAEGTGVCWPGADEGGGGCATGDNGGPVLPLMVTIGFVGLALTRRRSNRARG